MVGRRGDEGRRLGRHRIGIALAGRRPAPGGIGGGRIIASECGGATAGHGEAAGAFGDGRIQQQIEEQVIGLDRGLYDSGGQLSGGSRQSRSVERPHVTGRLPVALEKPVMVLATFCWLALRVPQRAPDIRRVGGASEDAAW